MVAQGLPLGLTGPGRQPIDEGGHSIFKDSERIGVSAPVYPALGFVALFAIGGCQMAHDFLPRTHTSSRSPDGRYAAFVHQGLNPPDDHLYLGPCWPVRAIPAGPRAGRGLESCHRLES